VTNKERIVETAVRLDDGEIFTGLRHIDAFVKAYERSGTRFRDDQMGFVTSTGRFVSRKEAAQIAYNAGQIRAPKDELFNDDLLH
jgi:hypothetical protein